MAPAPVFGFFSDAGAISAANLAARFGAARHRSRAGSIAQPPISIARTPNSCHCFCVPTDETQSLSPMASTKAGSGGQIATPKQQNIGVGKPTRFGGEVGCW